MNRISSSKFCFLKVAVDYVVHTAAGWVFFLAAGFCLAQVSSSPDPHLSHLLQRETLTGNLFGLNDGLAKVGLAGHQGRHK